MTPAGNENAVVLQVEEQDRPGRVLRGPPAAVVAAVAFGAALLAIGQVFRPLPQGSQYYLIVFLAVTLPLVFLVYGRAAKPAAVDWVLAAVTLMVCSYPLAPLRVASGGGGYDAFLDRQGLLEPVDVVMGAALLLLVLEACRRTTGWALPIVCAGFLAYGYYGGLLPQGWAIAHAGLDFDQIIDALYNSGSGFFGTPLDVAATYIVLFTIYGTVLELSGAAKFFVDLSVSVFRRSPSAAGRTAVASGFLLGTVSGSGTATAVSVGAVTWPILRRSGYTPEQAGGVLAASGVGALLSPPTLGAAAFILAEYLEVSYLTVLGWALIPTLLYYLGILLAVEIDARRFGLRSAEGDAPSPWRLIGRFGYHFSSLVAIVVLLATGMSATRAVVYATGLAVALSFLDRRFRLTPARLFDALSAGVRGVLPVVAVCAAAGVITAMTTKTGLGAQFSSVLVGAVQALSDDRTVVLILTALVAAVALALLGLAIPVTASFVIGWVIIGPALLALDVPAPAAAMFVFYYSVLSEVTPPTALAAVGAAAVTGGRAVTTMWTTLRYAAPGFLVPIAFVVTRPGEYLLGIGPIAGVLWATAAAGAAIVALSVTAGGWVPGVGPAAPIARVLAGFASVLLLFLEPVTIGVGMVCLLSAVILAAIDARRPT